MSTSLITGSATSNFTKRARPWSEQPTLTVPTLGVKAEAGVQVAPKDATVWNNVTDDGQPVPPPFDPNQPRPTTPPYARAVAAVCVGAGLWAAANIGVQLAGLPAATVGLEALKVAGVAGASWLAADAGSGVFHFLVDNYGSPTTPVAGNFIKAFQEHHIHPWDLETTSLASNVVHAGQILGPALLAVAAFNPHYLVQTAALSMVTAGVLTQGSHRWAHMKNPPAFAKVLQKAHVFQSPQDHQKHHQQPVERYCIVNGFWNEAFQRINLWRGLEYGIFKVTGAEPNSWLDPGIKAKALGRISQKEFEAHRREDRKTFWKALIHKLKHWDPRDQKSA